MSNRPDQFVLDSDFRITCVYFHEKSGKWYPYIQELREKKNFRPKYKLVFFKQNQTMPLTDNDIMPYGKHKGEKLANVPDSYWEYMLKENKLTPDLMQYAKDNQDIFEANKKRNRK